MHQAKTFGCQVAVCSFVHLYIRPHAHHSRKISNFHGLSCFIYFIICFCFCFIFFGLLGLTSLLLLSQTNKLSERKDLVKFRLGNHKLGIETGIYDQISPRAVRLCPIRDSNQIEDESHFLTHCMQ